MDLKDKINKIMQNQNLNSAQFASEIGIQGSTLSHIINGRNKPSFDVVQKILNRFNTINPDWLISDAPSMFRAEKNSQTPSLFDNIDENISKPIDYAPKNEQKFVPRNDTVQNKILNVPETPAQEIQAPSEFIAKPLETPSKIVKKIIVYYSDNTFQELETK
jgi:transcriptional regulator with XRE-family HTH domain